MSGYLATSSTSHRFFDLNNWAAQVEFATLKHETYA